MNAQTYLDRKQSEQHLKDRGLKISWKTLQKLATLGGGPVYRIFAGRAIYTPEDLDNWADEKMSAPRRSTSDVAAQSDQEAA